MKKIYKIALFSSPFIALYGVVPIYIFGFVPLREVITIFIALTIFTFVGWLINIFVLSITKNKERWVQYILSYLLTFFFHFGAILVGRLTNTIPEPPSDDRVTIIIYPVISFFAFNTVTLIIINLLLSQEKRQNAETQIQKLSVANLEAEKKILQQQLQPHFLFNSLSTLKSLIKDNPDEAENYAVKLSEFLRYSIDAHKSELISLEDELQFTEGYIELQKARFPNSFFCTITVSDEILNRKIPVFGLQTLVENAIKHNQFSSKRPLNVKIESFENSIKVTNNKLQNVPHSRGTGTGLSNLNKRYHLIADKEIEIQENSTEFMVILDLL
ncbi:MAG TPA: histidine kinase [Bacteroidia bacterium]